MLLELLFCKLHFSPSLPAGRARLQSRQTVSKTPLEKPARMERDRENMEGLGSGERQNERMREKMREREGGGGLTLITRRKKNNSNGLLSAPPCVPWLARGLSCLSTGMLLTWSKAV